MFGQNQTLKLVVRSVNRVAQPFLEEVGCPSTHAFDQAFWSAQIPVHQTWRRMDVGVDCGLGQVAALVASATKSDDLNGLDSLNDLFNLRGKVGQRGSYLNAKQFKDN